MKIISIENYNTQNHKIDIDTDNRYLCEIIDATQAKQERINMYINNRMHYVIGCEEVKFVFLNLISVPVYAKTDVIIEYIFQIELLVNNKVYKTQITQEEYFSEKWLKELRIGTILTITKSNYQKLINDLIPRDTTAIFSETIGIHRIADKYYYIASDCAISKDGKCDDIMALQEGFNLGYDENMDEKGFAKKFIEYNSMNLRVFYPFHCVAVLSILRYFLKEQGKRGGAILWVDGAVASGKTELAIVLGNFFNCGKSHEKMTSHLHTTKMKLKDMEIELVKYQSNIFVLDDNNFSESQ